MVCWSPSQLLYQLHHSLTDSGGGRVVRWASVMRHRNYRRSPRFPVQGYRAIRRRHYLASIRCIAWLRADHYQRCQSSLDHQLEGHASKSLVPYAPLRRRRPHHHGGGTCRGHHQRAGHSYDRTSLDGGPSRVQHIGYDVEPA